MTIEAKLMTDKEFFSLEFDETDYFDDNLIISLDDDETNFFF